MDDFKEYQLKAVANDQVRREIALKKLEILARLSAVQNDPQNQNLKNGVLRNIQDAIDGDKKTIIAWREIWWQEKENWLGGTAKRVLEEIGDLSVDKDSGPKAK